MSPEEQTWWQEWNRQHLPLLYQSNGRYIAPRNTKQAIPRGYKACAGCEEIILKNTPCNCGYSYDADKEKAAREASRHARGEVRNYVYHIPDRYFPTPDLTRELLDQNFELARKLQNRFIELYFFRKHLLQRAEAELIARHPQIEALVEKIKRTEEQIAVLREEVNSQRQQARKRIRMEETQLILELKASLKEMRRRLSEEKKSASADRTYQEQVKETNDLYGFSSTSMGVKAKELYAEYGVNGLGLHYDTITDIAGRVKQGINRSGKPPVTKTIHPGHVDRDGKQTSEVVITEKPFEVLCWSGDPRFRRYQDSGSLVYEKMPAQGRKYFTAHDLHFGEGRVKIRRTGKTSRSGRDQTKEQMILTYPMGHDSVDVPIIMHRPIDPNAFIKQMKLCREWSCRKWQYHFVATAVKSNGTFKPARTRTDKEIFVNLGWRMVGDGLRVAYWLDTEGQHGEIVLPTDRIKAFWERPKELQSIRSNLFNEVTARLRAFLESMPVPDWLKERTRTIAQWKASSQGRLASIILYWRMHRFSGDEQTFSLLEHSLASLERGVSHYDAWRNQDKHLDLWAAGLRRRGEEWRLDLYHKTAAKWAEEYDRLHIADVDWAKMRRNPLPEEESSEISVRYRNAAASGLFDQLLRAAFVQRLVVYDAKDLTDTCHVCGVRQEMGSSVIQVCGSGHTWDVDYNHVKNLAARFQVL
jgi:hypothetical protein